MKATTDRERRVPNPEASGGEGPAQLDTESSGPAPDPCAARIRAVLEDRDRLLSVSAHEIRTPLASLRLYLDALIKAAERGRLDPAEAATRLRKAQRQCDRLNVLINNMMDAARGQSKPISLVLETFDLVPVVMTACDRLRDQFTHQGRTLEVDVPAGGLLGDWDRPRLEQIVMNLLSNVYKHAPGASARVQVEPRDGERVVLRISDDGPGIPEEYRPFLFERQVESDRPKKHGMGLWIVGQIVRAFGGSICLEERPPANPGAAKGACFAIDLPVRRPLSPAGSGAA
ncbi:MAG TPA: HAMP domain-containing sensor histidine kinase [Polyangia bacterium]